MLEVGAAVILEARGVGRQTEKVVAGVAHMTGRG
jgi:hypothetical protein